MSVPPGPSPSVQDAESLLDQVAEKALDDDYYAAHERPAGQLAKVLTGVVAALFGLLLTVAGIQTRDDRQATAVERAALIENIRKTQELVDSRRAVVGQLDAEIADLQANSTGEDQAGANLRVVAGAVPVTGPGIVLRVTSSSDPDDTRGEVTDTDVQLIVNGLWLAGAEAVAIDGHRLTSTSAIRSAGEAITVNFKSVTEPILILAIGDPDTLVQRWTRGPSGRYLDDRTADGVTYTVRGSDEVQLPAAPASRLTVSATPLRRSES